VRTMVWGSNIGLWLDLGFRITGGSCGDLIFAGEPVKDRSAVDLVVGEIDRVWWLGVGLAGFQKSAAYAEQRVMPLVRTR
jgi:hypothetical protein